MVALKQRMTEDIKQKTYTVGDDKTGEPKHDTKSGGSSGTKTDEHSVAVDQ